MIVVLNPGLNEGQIQNVVERIESLGLRAHLSVEKERTIIGAIGDERQLSDRTLESFPGVERVVPILKPYKLVSQKFQQEDTVIEVAGHRIGGKKIHVMAGPYSVESSQQVLAAARPTQAAGATFLRGGALKPRSSPYSFQGLGYLASACDVTGLPIITEVLDPMDIDLVSRYADIL
jgi:3-deoxy-7-phosphoheptulonate synthase